MISTLGGGHRDSKLLEASPEAMDDRDQRFGCHQLSDGTLRALALITVLSQPTERLPRLISIDEPELGLHPAAIALIAELCRSISQSKQESSGEYTLRPLWLAERFSGS